MTQCKQQAADSPWPESRPLLTSGVPACWTHFVFVKRGTLRTGSDRPRWLLLLLHPQTSAGVGSHPLEPRLFLRQRTCSQRQPPTGRRDMAATRCCLRTSRNRAAVWCCALISVCSAMPKLGHMDKPRQDRASVDIKQISAIYNSHLTLGPGLRNQMLLKTNILVSKDVGGRRCRGLTGDFHHSVLGLHHQLLG